MLLYGKHINTLLRTQHDDRKSDETHDENALENYVTCCNLVVYHHPSFRVKPALSVVEGKWRNPYRLHKTAYLTLIITTKNFTL